MRSGRSIIAAIILGLLVMALLSATVGIGVGKRAVLGELLPCWVGLFFLTIAVAAMCGQLRLGGPENPKKAPRLTLGLACGIIGLAALAHTYIDAQGRADYRRFTGEEAVRLQVGCRTVSTPNQVGEIMRALRGAETFSDRTNWGSPLHLTVQLQSGEERDFRLASDLYQGRVIVGYGKNGAVAVPGLANALEPAGLAHKTSRWEPSTGKNVDSVVPDDTCDQSKPR